MEEQRLRGLLGPDYDRVIQFADWLQAQPAKSEVLARLQRQFPGTRAYSQAQAPQKKTPP
jgi:GrpB-like predicted nucleotidyltransferase (UPF0157 family)